MLLIQMSPKLLKVAILAEGRFKISLLIATTLGNWKVFTFHVINSMGDPNHATEDDENDHLFFLS